MSWYWINCSLSGSDWDWIDAIKVFNTQGWKKLLDTASARKVHVVITNWLKSKIELIRCQNLNRNRTLSCIAKTDYDELLLFKSLSLSHRKIGFQQFQRALIAIFSSFTRLRMSYSHTRIPRQFSLLITSYNVIIVHILNSLEEQPRSVIMLTWLESWRGKSRFAFSLYPFDLFLTIIVCLLDVGIL